MANDDVTILIEGKEWGAFSEFELSLGLDSYSAASFVAPFDYKRREIRDTFRPFSYKPCQVKIGGEVVFTGQLWDIVPVGDATSTSVQVTAYSAPYQLTINTPPPDALPLEFNKMDLRQIATKLVEPFGIAVEFKGDPGARFDRVACEPDQKIQDFLVDLAKQRGLVISDDPSGTMVFRQSVPTGSPVAVLKGQPLVKITPTFSPDSYYGQITGFASKKSGKSGSKWTQENKRYLGSNLRTLSFMLDDTDSADGPFAVRAKLGRMFGEVASYVTDDLPTWRTPRNALWRPNRTIKLTAPEVMIYRETEFLIRNVVLRANEKSRTASLGFVLPGAFSGELPEFQPWDEEL